MKDMQRAIRRADVARLKKKRAHYWGYGTPKRQVYMQAMQNVLDSAPGTREMSPNQLGRVVQHPQACSCYGCSGNYERRHFGRRSLKEISFAELCKAVDELD